jgi:hypothetical protein
MQFDWLTIDSLRDVESHYAPAFSVALDVCRACADSDYQNADKAHSLIFDEIISNQQIEWGSALADQFLIWREDIPPTLPAFLAMACDYFDIDDNHPLLNVALAACVLGETVHDNQFHNTNHFREVMVVTMRLCATWNMITDNADIRFYAADILLLIIAAGIHDFAHDGMSNVRDGVHVPSFLERRAIDNAAPFLIAAGISDVDLLSVQNLVIATDVSVDKDGNSPAKKIQKIVRHHLEGQPVTDDIDNFFMNNAKLSIMALILSEADITPSTGLSYDFSKIMTRYIAAEDNDLEPTAATLDGFMTTTCKKRYTSPATRHLMMENFTKISLEASIDSENNVSYI